MPNSIQLADVGDAKKVSKEDMQTLFNKMKMTKDAKAFSSLTDPRKVNQGFFSKAWDVVTFTPKEFLSGEEVMEVQNEVERAIKFRMDDKKARKYGMAPAVEGIKSAGVDEAINKLGQLDNERNKNLAKVEGWEDGTEQVQIQVDWNAVLDQKDMNAMESVRWKT
ncbi:hypothetical protein ACGLDM_004742, partial [Salmonella enterica subsp. enterica serovar Braenderup]